MSFKSAVIEALHLNGVPYQEAEELVRKYMNEGGGDLAGLWEDSTINYDDKFVEVRIVDAVDDLLIKLNRLPLVNAMDVF